MGNVIENIRPVGCLAIHHHMPTMLFDVSKPVLFLSFERWVKVKGKTRIYFCDKETAVFYTRRCGERMRKMTEEDRYGTKICYAENRICRNLKH